MSNTDNINDKEILENFQESFFVEEKTKEILAGYKYEYKKNSFLKSCFIDGTEYFIANEVYNFMNYNQSPRNKYIQDQLKEYNMSLVLNKWELLQGGFDYAVSSMTLCNKDGIIKTIEMSDFLDNEKIAFVDREILNTNNQPEKVETRCSRYMQLPISVLNFDMVYQRKTSKGKVNEIARKFDSGVVGALIISKRENGYYVVDGQHRILAMELNHVKNAMCLVHEGLTLEQEAELYIKCNNSRKAPSATDNFRAKIISGDPVSKDILKICEEIGYKLLIDKNANIQAAAGFKITSVSGLITVYKTYGADIFRETLNLYKQMEVTKPTGSEIHALSLFIKRYGNEFSRKDMVYKLNKVSQVEIMAKARNMKELLGGHTTTNIARIMLGIYNNGKVKKLEDKLSNLK